MCCADKVLATDVLRPYCLMPSQAVLRRQDRNQRLLDKKFEVQASGPTFRASAELDQSLPDQDIGGSGEDFVVNVTSTSAASSRRILNALTTRSLPVPARSLDQNPVCEVARCFAQRRTPPLSASTPAVHDRGIPVLPSRAQCLALFAPAASRLVPFRDRGFGGSATAVQCGVAALPRAEDCLPRRRQ